MNSLRSKASRFFRDSPTPDEKAAIADSSDVNFDAGIEGVDLKKKPSRFFGRKCDKTSNLDKPLPAPPASPSTSTLLAHVAGQYTATEPHGDAFDELPEYEDEDDPIQFPPAPREFSTPLERTATSDHKHNVGEGDQHGAPKLKSKGSLAALKSKSSRFLRGKNKVDDTAPPMPQLPMFVPEPKARKAVLTAAPSTRNSHASTSNTSLTKPKDRILSISRPTLMSQAANPPIPSNTITVSFIKRAGPPPPRPTRPESLDEETLAFMRENGTRMVLPSTPRSSGSTATTSTPRSQTSSIEARLGFPTGFGDRESWIKRSCSIESPLAAHFSGQRLPVRDSEGSIRYSRFSEYVKYAAQSGGKGADGVEARDREIGPIEQYRASKEGEWVLEKRVSKKEGGQGGMLFRDRWGGFHFVADI